MYKKRQKNMHIRRDMISRYTCPYVYPEGKCASLMYPGCIRDVPSRLAPDGPQLFEMAHVQPSQTSYLGLDCTIMHRQSWTTA